MKLDIHYIPRHGSWLNMAEIETSMLRRECLDRRRIPDRDVLAREPRTWRTRRDGRKAAINWRFTLEETRIK